MSISALQEYTRISKYARYNEEKQRRETWAEQITRVMDMHRVRYKEYLPNIQEELSFGEVAMLKKQVLGSQRALQFGGRAILEKHARLYNCLSKDTEFITNKGVKSFNDFEHEQKIEVLTHTGKWKKAKVKCYGKDYLNKITFSKGKSKENIVYATEDHTWILKNGERTNNLKIGQQLYKSPSVFNFNYDEADPMQKLYWCYGLVYGDGTKVKYNGKHEYSMIRLCGYDKQYKDRFEEMGFKTSSNNSLNGDFFAYTGSYLKTLPQKTDDLKLITAFVKGFLDADAEKNKRHDNDNYSEYLSIQQTSKESQDFIRTFFPMVGVYIISETKIDNVTNFGKHDAVRFRISTRMGGTSPIWKVKSIERKVKEEGVWCLEVEDEHSFVMPNGIVTGNCTVSYCDRPRFFQESMYLLLCGCGVGFSVQKHHIAKLPKIGKLTNPKKHKIVIEDSIEGWADAIGSLVNSYFQTPSEISGKEIEFDFSLIRPAGAIIKSSGGKAPGPDGLKNSLKKIKEIFERLLDEGKDRLGTIDAYDVVMHTSDAVLSGGVRRSATICLFSIDDVDMINAKTGDWFIQNPQRGRSNNSVVLIRNETTYKQFTDIIESVKEFGEPGFVWADSKEALFNPCVEIGMYAYDEDGNSGWSFCVKGDTKLITKNGITDIQDTIGKNTEIWNGKEWCNVKPFKTNTNQKLYRVNLSDGSYLDCTSEHRWSVKDRFSDNYSEVMTKDLMSFSKYPLHTPPPNVKFTGGIDKEYSYEYGYILGDGCCKRTDTKNKIRTPFANLFDQDLNLPLHCKIIKEDNVNKHGTQYTSITFPDVDKEYAFEMKYKDGLPNDMFSWSRTSLIDFFAGWIDSDGSVASRGIRIYGTEDKLRDGQLLLTKMGLYSSVNLSQKKDTKTNLGTRLNDLWYLQINNTEDLYSNKFDLVKSDRKQNGKEMYQIIKNVVELDGLHDTFCLTEEKRHLCLFNNVITHQCNLCELNVKKAKTREEFLDMCKGGAILGTLQAGYHDFEYLGEVTERIVKREALLGVSMTGMMDNPDIAFDPELQREGAKLIRKVNEKLATKIGIEPCARATCVKPAGCQKKDTLISTNEGILRLDEIGDIYGEQWQEHDIEIYTDVEKKKSPNFYVNGLSKTKKILLDSGLELESTLNHKYRVITDNKEYVWKRADELICGDVLPFSLGEYNGGNIQNLTSIDYNWDKNTPIRFQKNIQMPSKLNDDLALFLGMYYGDGSNHKRGIRISGNSNEKKGFDKLTRIIKEQFGLNSKYQEDYREGKRCYLGVYSKPLLAWLRANDLLKNKSNDISFPLAIRKSPKHIIESFILGFQLADGCDKSDRGISYVTTSKQFADELTIVLRAIGRECKMRLMPPTKSSFGENMRYWVQERKGINGNINKITNYRKDYYDILKTLNLNNHSVDKIINISDSETETFDIEVEDTHTYISNSYISHNTTSCILGTASGIHPHHSKRYFRRMQVNKLEETYKFFKKYNPLATEESVWSANNTDDIINFLCEVPKNARTKVDTDAIKLLDHVKLTQMNWVSAGRNKARCTQEWLQHNVSNTIHVRDDEWETVAKYIYQNRKYFAGISLLSVDGDKDYPQAPFTTVYTSDEITKEYGSGALMASGLIVDGLRAWDMDLWACCDAMLGKGENLSLPEFSSKKEENRWKRQNNYTEKMDWLRRGAQFSVRYFGGDVKKMTYCLKDVYNLKQWEDLKRVYVDVPWEHFHEQKDNTTVSDTIACAGGSCDVKFL